jgi:hypothetical protein
MNEPLRIYQLKEWVEQWHRAEISFSRFNELINEHFNKQRNEKTD